MTPIEAHLGRVANCGLARIEGEPSKWRALGTPPSEPAPAGILRLLPSGRLRLPKRAISARSVLSEASGYASASTRGLRVDLPGGVTHLVLSGTASVGSQGEILYPGDFRAQLWRTYRNLTMLLESEGANWHDVIRKTCYIRDLERNYQEFNSVRDQFFTALGLDPFPSSIGIQARICRSDLLVEIEALAILVKE